jgi:hypothetical protein
MSNIIAPKSGHRGCSTPHITEQTANPRQTPATKEGEQTRTGATASAALQQEKSGKGCGTAQGAWHDTGRQGTASKPRQREQDGEQLEGIHCARIRGGNGEAGEEGTAGKACILVLSVRVCMLV